MKYKLEIIFAQFNAANRGWTSGKHPSFSLNRRLDPTYTQVKQYFPDAKLTLYTDAAEIGEPYPDVEVRLITEDKFIQGKNHHKWGWNNADYYQIKGLLDSKAEIAISVDSDLMFVSDEVRTLLPIIEKFGVCCPQNERQLVKVDAIHTRGNDGDYRIGEDASRGNLLTYDLWWNGFHTKNDRARKLLEEFARLMKTNPRRSPLQYTRAAWNTGFHPYSMPKQWGVGSGHIGCGNEVILHVGHLDVQDHYLEHRIK